MMETKITDFIDFNKVNTLLEGFNQSTGFVTAILDLEGNILSKSGWRRICTDFHRLHPETAQRCTISDTVLAGEMKKGEKYRFYKCLNGLVDVAVPIIINGEHIANLFSGQFFLEKPVVSFYRKQAAQFGFNQTSYLKALSEVPVISESKVKIIMEFLHNMTQFISEMAFQKLELIELNKVIKENEDKFRNVFESANVGKSITLPSGEMSVNEAFCNMLGYSADELKNKKWQDLTPEDEIPTIQKILEPLFNGSSNSGRFEKRYICKNGSFIWADVSVSLRRDDNNILLYFITTIINITERKQAEEQLRSSEELFSNAFHVGPSGMTITRIADGKFIDVNESFCKMFELNRDDVVGHTSTELNIWTPAERKKIIDQQLSSGGLQNTELFAQTKSGRRITILFSSKQVQLNGEACHITTMIDVTEQKISELKLKESEARFFKVFHSSPVGITIFRLSDNKCIDVNTAFLDLIGYSREEVVGKTAIEFNLFAEAEQRYSWMQDLSETGCIRNSEVQIQTKSGETKDILSSFVTTEINDEMVVLVIGNDITARKHAEYERQKFVMLANNSSEFIGMCDINLNPIYVNPAGQRMVGLPDLEASCKVKVTDYFFPEDQQFISDEFFPRVLRDGHGDVEIRLRHFQTGEAIWMYYYLFHMRDANGTLIGWATVSRDITERKKTDRLLQERTDEIETQNEEYLQINEELTQTNSELFEAKERAEESEKQIKTMFSALNAGIAKMSLDGAVLEWNSTFINYFGYSPEEFKMLNTKDLTHPDDIPQTMQYVSQVIHNQIDSFRIEKRFLKKDGTTFWVDLSGTALKKKDKAYALLGVVYDITERKNIELLLKQQFNELKIAKEHAEDSDRLKTAFLQNMSHEIRTPMNAIMGFSNLLFENFNNKTKLKNFTDIINHRCNDLLDIINDILDISKIESGQLPINIVETNLNEVFVELSSFFKEYQRRIDKQQIKFVIQEFSAPEDNLILTDKVKLKQIFINLISNAFKFTDEGRIECGCKFDTNHNLLFYVSDTGVGIPEDKHQYVFERFVQLQQSTKKNIGGTGLGLPIVKALVNLLGGQVYLESAPGKGSTFSFIIPYIPARHSDSQPSQPDSLKFENFLNKTILVVEDDYYNAEYISEALAGTGLNILLAQNGEQAICISLSQPIDIILMDIRLPDIDGYEATRQIKQHKTNLKIVAQTAYAAHDENQKALDAGCIDYISKPTKRETLLSVLNRHLIG